MKSYFEGYAYGRKGTYHLIQYFDGQRIRESSVAVADGKIFYLERTIPGIIEVGMNYRTAKRRVASYEEKAKRRVG